MDNKKICAKCEIPKELEEFNKNNSNKKTGLSAYCSECVRKESKKNYLRHNERYRNKHKEFKKQYKQWFWEYKATLKCNRCPENHPSTLDFHHLDPEEKENSISNMIRGGKSKEEILEKIAKCEVLCSNCHRKEHWIEK